MILYSRLFSSGFCGGFTVFIDDSLETIAELVKRRLHGAHHSDQEFFLGRSLCQLIQCVLIKNFSVNVTTLENEVLMVSSVLFKNLCGSDLILFAGCESGHAEKSVLQTFKTGLVKCLGKIGILDDSVFNAVLSQLSTELCIVLNGNALIIDQNTRAGIFDLRNDVFDDLFLLL